MAQLEEVAEEAAGPLMAAEEGREMRPSDLAAAPLRRRLLAGVLASVVLLALAGAVELALSPGRLPSVWPSAAVEEWGWSKAAGCVVIRAGKLLVVKHAKTNKIDIPGGLVDGNEPYGVAAGREGWEESGYAMVATSLIHVAPNDYHIFECKLLNPNPTRQPQWWEVTKVMWIPMDRLQFVGPWRFPREVVFFPKAREITDANDPTKLNAAGCVVFKDDKLLLVRRAGSHLLDIPGGRPDIDQDAEHTAGMQGWRETGWPMVTTRLLHQQLNGFHIFECKIVHPFHQTGQKGPGIEDVLWIPRSSLDRMTGQWRFPDEVPFFKQAQEVFPPSPNNNLSSQIDSQADALFHHSANGTAGFGPAPQG